MIKYSPQDKENNMFFQTIEDNSDYWTNKLDTLAKVTGLHSILVMASLPASMKVILANNQPIYSPHDEGPKSVQAGCHELYCERVVNTKQSLYVKDASSDPEWVNNEDLVKFGLGTYLGMPLLVDDEVIGTVCVLNKSDYDFEAGIPSAYQRLLDLKMEIEEKISRSIKVS